MAEKTGVKLKSCRYCKKLNDTNISIYIAVKADDKEKVSMIIT